MSVQTSFPSAVESGLPGLIADLNPAVLNSSAAEGAIPFGFAVQDGTLPDDQKIIASGGNFAGIAVRQNARESVSGAYADGDDMEYITDGYVYAEVLGTGSKGAALTYLTTSGQLTTAAVGGTHIATSCVLAATHSVGGALVKVRVAAVDAFLAARITAAESDIDTLQTDLSAAESDIDTLQTDLSAAESDIDTLQTLTEAAIGDTYTNPATLDSRVTTLETP